MRTTLTLDDDVAAQLSRLQKERKVKLRQLVNEALREGLPRLEDRRTRKGRFRIRVHHSGGCLLPNLDCVGKVLAYAEGDDYK